MLLSVGALFAGCGERTVEEPHGTVRVRPGQEFVLEFPTNPSVGTDWRRDTRLGPNRAAAYLGARGRAGGSGHRGGGVRENFRFEGRAPARPMVTLTKLFRGEPRERRSVRILVRERGSDAQSSWRGSPA